jgi:sec-independent protein translocase protein TatA
MGSIGAPELIILLLVVLLLFGSTKLPKLARSIGEASKEFKKGVNEGGHESAPAAPASAPANAAPAATSAPAALPADESVTMTRAELDAMLAERETKDPPAS